MEAEVKPLEASSIYLISAYIEYLKLAKTDDRIVYDDGSVEKEGKGYILHIMDKLKESLIYHGLASSEISGLESLIKNFRIKYYRKHDNKKIENTDVKKLYRCLHRIDAVVTNELEGRSFYEVSFSGLLNYPELLNKGISMLFSDENILENIAEIVKYDLKEAVRCLAYNTPTASAMISLRAVEGALREYYKTLSSEELEIRESWGSVLEKVSQLATKKEIGSKELIGYLDYIRTVRNKAEHPQEIFKKKES